MPEIVPYPAGFATAVAAILSTATIAQRKVRPIDFMGTGYLPAAPFEATF